MLIFGILGLFIGILVGTTGIGGGALLTPALIFLGVEPLTAVGTDLFYTTLIKGLGTLLYKKRENMNGRIALILFSGSLPAIFVGAFVLNIVNRDVLNHYLTMVLGVILVTTSLMNLIKTRKFVDGTSMASLTLIGFMVGMTVQFTSVGAGILVTFFLVNFYGMNPHSAVGTSIFYGLMITILATLVHLSFGNVDMTLLKYLVVGGTIGMLIGVRINSHVSADKLKKALNMLIMLAGITILLSFVI